ncbi:MAG TPA: hypothetical protein VG345_02725 [Bryobacteraceae bacterium]|nr:hypothetical protein [Bryobacteraceae bacterium]
MQRLFAILAARKPKLRRFYRNGYFTDGKKAQAPPTAAPDNSGTARSAAFGGDHLRASSKVIWEYPHETPNGEQMDFVEVMEIENGLIHKHRVYWGWFGFNVLKNDRYRR